MRTVNDGDTVPQPQTPVREGYDFRGWVGIDGSAFDFTLPITADTLVSAKWKRCEEPKPVTHTVTFNPNGGTVVEPQTVTDGQPVRRPADPVKDGYVFDGWYLGNDQYDFDRPVTQDLTLTAAWEKDTAATTPGNGSGSNSGTGSDVNGSTGQNTGDADTDTGETKRNPLAATGATVLGVLATAVTAIAMGVGLMVARKRGKKF